MLKNFENWKSDKIDEGIWDSLKSLGKTFLDGISKKIQKPLLDLENGIKNNSDAKDLKVLITNTFGSIYKSTANDLKTVDDKDELIEILIDFLGSIKATFKVAKVPYKSLLESKEILQFEKLFEYGPSGKGKANAASKVRDSKSGRFVPKNSVTSAPSTPKTQSPEPQTPPADQGKKTPSKESIQKFFHDLMNIDLQKDQFEREARRWAEAWLNLNFPGKEIEKMREGSLKLVNKIIQTFNSKISGMEIDRLKEVMKSSPSKTKTEEVETKNSFEDVKKSLLNLSGDEQRQLKDFLNKRFPSK